MSFWIFNKQTTAPSAPAADKVTIYSRLKKMYFKDEDGLETPMFSSVTSPVAIGDGGTGQTTATAGFNALDPTTTKGDLISHDGTNAVRRAVGTNGQVLTADSAQADGIKWATPSSSGAADPLGTLDLRDDFPTVGSTSGLVGQLGWFVDTAGTAPAVTRKNGIADHPGIITLRPGTSATGRAAIALGGDGFNSQVVGDGVTEVTWIVRSSQVLANFEMMVIGLGDTANVAGDQVNGIYFQLLTADTNWFLVNASASSRTRRDTGIAYALNQWFKLKITINALGTSVQANIDGTDAGAALTTTIPTAAISAIAKLDGNGGGVNGDTDIDFFRIVKTLTTTR